MIDAALLSLDSRSLVRDGIAPHLGSRRRHDPLIERNVEHRIASARPERCAEHAVPVGAGKLQPDCRAADLHSTGALRHQRDVQRVNHADLGVLVDLRVVAVLSPHDDASANAHRHVAKRRPLRPLRRSFLVNGVHAHLRAGRAAVSRRRNSRRLETHWRRA